MTRVTLEIMLLLGAVQVSRDQIWALSRPPPSPLVIESDILAYSPLPPYLIAWYLDSIIAKALSTQNDNFDS